MVIGDGKWNRILLRVAAGVGESPHGLFSFCKENLENILTRKLGSGIVIMQSKLCKKTIKLGKGVYL